MRDFSLFKTIKKYRSAAVSAASSIAVLFSLANGILDPVNETSHLILMIAGIISMDAAIGDIQFAHEREQIDQGMNNLRADIAARR